MHKYFFETSPIWRQVREEEEQAKKDLQQEPLGDDDLDDDEQPDPSTVQFDPIDSRHLSSLPLIQSRVTKLLQNSPHGLYAMKNILLSIVSCLLHRLLDTSSENMLMGIRNCARGFPSLGKQTDGSSPHVYRS